MQHEVRPHPAGRRANFLGGYEEHKSRSQPKIKNDSRGALGAMRERLNALWRLE
jgi:hypothetical protein